MKNKDKLYVIRNFRDPLTAQFLCAYLKENGVPAILKDLNFNFPSAIFGSKSSGIKLLVFEKDREIAEELLTKNDDLPSDEDDTEE